MNGGRPGARSRRQSDFSGRAARLHQQRENSVCKAAEQNFSTKIFKLANVIDMRTRAVYLLENLNDTPIYSHFCRDELTPVRITDRTSYKRDKILHKGVIGGICEYFFLWRGYSQEIDLYIGRRTTHSSKAHAFINNAQDRVESRPHYANIQRSVCDGGYKSVRGTHNYSFLLFNNITQERVKPRSELDTSCSSAYGKTHLPNCRE